MIKTTAIGVVQYSISQTEPNTIDAIYLSTSNLAAGQPVICTGIAKGDTSNGFPGRYAITYLGPDGSVNGAFDWEIESVGDTFKLLWRMKKDGVPYIPGEEGMPVLQGIGIANSPTSIIVSYWTTPEIIVAFGFS
ncbi:MAG TPA: hypothetical protein VGK97_06105 [Spongiibacteraceae bacterium]|jgi:hypothetical protein